MDVEVHLFHQAEEVPPVPFYLFIFLFSNLMTINLQLFEQQKDRFHQSVQVLNAIGESLHSPCLGTFKWSCLLKLVHESDYVSHFVQTD